MDGIERLRGVWSIVPTPFTEDGTLDEPSIRTLVDFVAGTGIDGLTILGVLGEASKLSDAERSRVIAVAEEQAAGRLPICVGVSHAGTDQAVAYAREAQACDAHSVMLAPPALSRPNEAAVRRHYLAVAAAVDLPIVVQDHPASSGVWMSAEFLLSLTAEVPTCRVIKLEEEPSSPKVRRLLEADEDLAILGGLGGMMLLEELRAGAVGTMTGFGYPEILVDIVRRWFAGDRDGARDVFFAATPLIRFENQAILNLAIRKEIYRRRGAIASARVRAPSPSLDPGTLADLDDLLARLELPSPS
jgi:4-hydroxy-tetrahydrodipicolinate synthase